MDTFTLIIQSLGSASLGIVVGWLVRYFLYRYKEFNAKILGATISPLMGGAVIKFIGKTNHEIVPWFYPIGILIGFIIYTIVGYITRNDESLEGYTFFTESDDEKQQDEKLR